MFDTFVAWFTQPNSWNDAIIILFLIWLGSIGYMIFNKD